MKHKLVVRTLAVATVLALSSATGFAQAKPVKKKTVGLKDAKGARVGTATIVSLGQGVEVKLALKNLPPGEHAVHFHKNAKCDPPDFKSSGEHFNPAGKQHGFDNPNGHHAGDMMNVTVKDDGAVMVTVKNDDVVLGTSTESNSLFANARDLYHAVVSAWHFKSTGRTKMNSTTARKEKARPISEPGFPG